MPTPSAPATAAARPLPNCKAGRSNAPRLRSVRPSLLDPRFPGDAWIVAADDGVTALFLENSCLVRLQLLPFDVAALNGTLQAMRWCRRRLGCCPRR
jgi:hypothetical protein